MKERELAAGVEKLTIDGKSQKKKSEVNEQKNESRRNWS